MNSSSIKTDVAKEIQQLQVSQEPKKQRRPECTPLCFQQDPATGIYWPEFWLQKIIAAVSHKTTVPINPPFILVPKRLMENGKHQIFNDCRIVFSLSPLPFTTAVLEGPVCLVTQASWQDQLMKAAAKSCYRLKSPVSLMRTFTRDIVGATNRNNPNGSRIPAATMFTVESELNFILDTQTGTLGGDRSQIPPEVQLKVSDNLVSEKLIPVKIVL